MILAMIAAVAALQTEPLKPSGKWVVDYAEDMCTVARPFGPDGTTFGFRPDGFAGQGGMIVVIQPATSGARHHQFKQQIEVADGGEAIQVNPRSYYLRDRKSRIITMIVNAETLGRLKAAPSFDLPVNAREHVAFAPTDLDAALKALDACSDDLMTTHGVPVAELADAVVRTSPVRAERWFNYPSSSVASGAEGRIVTLISVSDQGKPTECRILGGDAENELAKSACESIRRRGEFDPARNKDGRAIRSWTTLTITYQIG